MRRWLRLGLPILACAAALAAWLRPRPLGVEVTHVERGLVVESVEDEGLAWVRRRARVAAPVSGLLAEPTLRPGDAVRAGEVVARLVSLPAPLSGQESVAALRARADMARSGVARALASLQQAEAAAGALEVERRRTGALFNAGSVARAQLDDVEGRAHVLAHETAAARSALAMAREELASAEAAVRQAESGERPGRALELRSPLDGVVLAVPLETAGPVGAGVVLVEVGQLSSMEIRAPFLSEDVARLRAGMVAEVRGWGGPPLGAHVLRVEPQAATKVSVLGVEESRARVVLGLDAEPPPELGDGFRVRAVVMPWRGEVVRVAAAALVRAGEGWGAWRILGGRARWTPVVRGHAGGDWAEVLEGLAPGDAVVRYPDERMAEGRRVAGETR